jgi:hypothetical protein
LVAELGFRRDSWIAPVDVRRVGPYEDANDIAAEQIEALIRRLPQRRPVPLFVFDAGYDPVRLQKGLEGCAAQILVCLHSGRTFYADPPTPERRPVGRPFVHGEKFDLKDPQTWPEPALEHRSEKAGYGKVRVRAWSGLHPKTRRAGERTSAFRASCRRPPACNLDRGRRWSRWTSNPCSSRYTSWWTIGGKRTTGPGDANPDVRRSFPRSRF